MTASSYRVWMPLLFAVTVVVAVSGCGGDGRMEIQGTATWNGEPIQDGYVELRPTDGAGQVVGADIREGKFVVRSVPGAKSVSVTARKQVGEIPANDRIPHPEPIYQQIIPEKFNDRSELLITIAAGQPTLELALEGEEARAVTQEQRAMTASRR